jgi:hypothetical protein
MGHTNFVVDRAKDRILFGVLRSVHPMQPEPPAQRHLNTDNYWNKEVNIFEHFIPPRCGLPLLTIRIRRTQYLFHPQKIRKIRKSEKENQENQRKSEENQDRHALNVTPRQIETSSLFFRTYPSIALFQHDSMAVFTSAGFVFVAPDPDSARVSGVRSVIRMTEAPENPRNMTPDTLGDSGSGATGKEQTEKRCG